MRPRVDKRAGRGDDIVDLDNELGAMGDRAGQVARHPAVGDIRELVTFRIAMLAATGDRVGQRWLGAEYGLRIQEWRVLGVVTALAPVRFGEVAHALLLDKGRLSRLVKDLVARGLLESRADPDDQRTMLLAPSAAGRRLHDRVLPRALERNQQVLAALTQAEAATLFALLDKLQPFMERRAGNDGPGSGPANRTGTE